MTLDELKARLGRYEWNDVEFKAARNDVPRDAYKSVSAFANTKGGYLVFGIEQEGQEFKIVGVLDVDKVQNDFLSALRSGQLLNRIICVQETALEEDGCTLLVFFVPEMSRREKPVYLNGDIRSAHIRRGGGDEKCTREEIERFLRDASDSPFDGEIMTDLRAEDFFEAKTLAWYRRIFQDRNGGKHAELNDVEFLHEFGFVREHEDTLAPTRAGVLLFGAERNVRQVLNRAVVDYQRLDRSVEDEDSEVRWDDRVVIEENLIQTWQTLFEKYAQLASHKFGLDASTMRRADDPPDFVTFREAVVNLIVHQDFGDSRRMPTIKIFRDETQLFNPGDAFASTSELLDPGDKEVRNPTILSAFRRIGLSDQAGTGIRAICREWSRLGHVPPSMENDKSAKCFRLALNRTRLLSEEQVLFQAQLGVRLSEDEARIFAVICSEDSVSIVDAKAALAKPEQEIRRILGRLEVQQLIEQVASGSSWTLKPHLREAGVGGGSDRVGGDGESLVTPRSDQAGEVAPVAAGTPSDQAAAHPASLVTPASDQVKPLIFNRFIRSLSEAQKQILLFCDVPKPQEAIMRKMGVTHRTHFRNRQLRPLLDAHLLHLTHPENPTHPDQAYVVAPGALELLARLAEPGTDASG